MRDRNTILMATVGGVLLFALAAFVGGQLYAGNAERTTKDAACTQAKSGLANTIAARAANHAEGGTDADQRTKRQEQASDEKLLVDAISGCAAAIVLPSTWRFALSAFIGAIGPFIGMMAFFLAGLRYDAGVRFASAGPHTRLDIVPERGTGGRIWTIRNAGGVGQLVLGVRVMRFRHDNAVVLARSSFEFFTTGRRLEVGEATSFEVVGAGPDIVVAVLSDGLDGRGTASWARFCVVDAHRGYEKREDGRSFNL